MSKPRQSTLFQSWGRKSESKNGSDKSQIVSGLTLQMEGDENFAISISDEDDEDQELVQTLKEHPACPRKSSSNGNSLDGDDASGQPADPSDGNISFGIEEQDIDRGTDRSHCLPQWRPSDLSVGELPGFDRSAGQLWIYPINYCIREYQFNIVQQALVKNTLVILPTGLGKTFIAAVIMYNFYRWYPEGKVIFMAPTKPLVSQQIEACYNVMGIPQDDTVEMTGSMNPNERQKAWKNRRVFFLTPQVMINDISRGTCAAETIKCVVVDEAHKALGNHAYCQVVRKLVKYTRQFRVLALSATPGNDIKSVQNVVTNLAISHIELRSEESPDIKPYTYERKVEKIVVPLGEELGKIKAKYTQVLSGVVKRLVQRRLLYNREATSLSKFLILKAREAFRQNPPQSLSKKQYGIVEGDFALAMSLYHGFELLQLHGLRSLFNFLGGIISGDKAYGRTRLELMKNADFIEIIEFLQRKFHPSFESELQSRQPFLAGHPKMIKLEEIVLEHFHSFEAVGQETRVMIFSQYRDSVKEITAMLQQHQSLMKVMSFIGQSSVGKASKGFTQKEQLKVMKAFRTGSYNTLVSTCVGEEGLDIGDVDLIICFDAHKSPIRLIQRMGRTGRKRKGRIVMLMTEGKEEQIYNCSQYAKQSIHRTILSGARSLMFYANNPRMIPPEITPSCHRMYITVQQCQSSKKQNDRQHMGKIKKHFSETTDCSKTIEKEADISFAEFIELKSFDSTVTFQYHPAPRILTLESTVSNSSLDKDGALLGEGEWLAWQNCLQAASLFGHSKRSKDLVELIEFTDLQQLLLPEEDSYGQEMHAYLDMDDVISNQKHPFVSDISQFVISAKKTEDQKMHKGQANKHKHDHGKMKDMAGKIRSIKKNSALPTEIGPDSDDSASLPEVDFTCSSIRCERKIIADAVISTKTLNDNSDESCLLDNYKIPKSDSPDDDNISHLMSKNLEMNEHPYIIYNNTVQKDFQVSPPSLEEIPGLLDFLEPKDLMSVQVFSVLNKCPVSILPLFSGYIPLSALVTSLCEQCKQEKNFSNSLNDAQFENFLQKILTSNRSKAKGKSKSDSSPDYVHKFQGGFQTKKCSTALLSSALVHCHGQNTLQPCLSQASLSIDKPLSSSARTSNPETDSLANTQKSEQSSEDIHRLQDPLVNEQCKKYQISMCYSLQSLASNSIKEKYNRSLNETCSSLENQRPLVIDKISEKQSLPSEMKWYKTFDSNNSFHETLVHDSFLSKNIGDDKECENTEVFLENSLHQPLKQSTNKNLRVCTNEHSLKSLLSSKIKATTNSAVPETSTKCLSSEQEHFSTNETMFTFTQALACVHNHSFSNPDCFNSAKDGMECMLEVSELGADRADYRKISKMDGQPQENEQLYIVEEDENKQPNFDLGFDFDEDIIPPSLNAETQLFELTGKSVVTKLLFSSSHSDETLFFKTHRQDSSSVGPYFNAKQVHNVDKSRWQSKEGDTVETAEKPCTSSAQLEIEDITNIGKRSLTAWVKNQNKQTEPSCWQYKYIKRHVAFDCETIRSPSQGFQSNNNTLETSVDNTVDEVLNSNASTSKDLKSGCRHDGLFQAAVAEPQLKVSSVGISSPCNDHSFKKQFHLSPAVAMNKVTEEELDSDFKETSETVKSKTGNLPERFAASAYCSTPVSSNTWKDVMSVAESAKKKMLDFNFEEVNRKKASFTPKKNQKSKKSKGCAFLDDEAELSDDVAVSSDEADEDNMDELDNSFIISCTEMTQASQIDMQAVYMKSVQSPVCGGKYRLQYNHAPINVYSQPLCDEEEESQYQQDSFCVGSEEGSDCVDSIEENSLKRITKKQSRTVKRNGRPLVKQAKGRKRVYQLADSSSSGDDDVNSLPAGQISPLRRISFRKALSSSEENLEVSGMESLQAVCENTKCKKRKSEFNDFLETNVEDLKKARYSQCFKSTCYESKDLSVVDISERVHEHSSSLLSVHCIEKSSSYTSTSTFQDQNLPGIEAKSTDIHATSLLSSTVGVSEHGQNCLVTLTTKPGSCVMSESIGSSPADCSSDSGNQRKSPTKSSGMSLEGTSRLSAVQLSEQFVCEDEDNVDQQKMAELIHCLVTGNREAEKLTILVDSREISCAQDILSALRLDHGALVCTRHLAACDYVLSNRLAVERFNWSNFSSGNCRSKLCERIQHMQNLYDRCVVIVEKNRVKPGDENAIKPPQNSKYVNSLLAQFHQTSVKIFFTDNQGETAKLLAQMATLESRKGMAITAPVSITPEREQILKYYLTIPRLTITQAFNLCFNFKSIHDFMISSVKGVQTQGHMSFARATEVVNYVRHHFLPC